MSMSDGYTFMYGGPSQTMYMDGYQPLSPAPAPSRDFWLALSLVRLDVGV